MPRPAEIEESIFHIDSADGHSVAVHHFYNKASAQGSPQPAVVYCHGGGYVALSAVTFANNVATLASATNRPFFSVEYRLAPEHPYPKPHEDCFAALKWVSSNAAKYNVDPARIAIMGDSAGGGLAAGVAIAARDHGLSPPLRKQILIYPMLDDRNFAKDPNIEDRAIWKNADNIGGWTAYLTSARDPGNPASTQIPSTAAPGRLTDFSGLPETYIDVGELDYFRDENIAYAQGLFKAGIQTELHVYQGIPHAFEIAAPQSGITQRASAARLAALTTW